MRSHTLQPCTDPCRYHTRYLKHIPHDKAVSSGEGLRKRVNMRQICYGMLHVEFHQLNCNSGGPPRRTSFRLAGSRHGTIGRTETMDNSLLPWRNTTPPAGEAYRNTSTCQDMSARACQGGVGRG